MRVPLLLLVFALASAPPGPEVYVDRDRVTIRAKAVSLTAILEVLSRKTGMEVLYEGAPPRLLVDAALEGVSEADVLTKLFEGSGVSYLFLTDAAGARVHKLVVRSTGPPASTSQASLPAPESQQRNDAAGAAETPDPQPSDAEDEGGIVYDSPPPASPSTASLPAPPVRPYVASYPTPRRR